MNYALTHYQMTNFRLFQTERVCRRQFQIWRKWLKVNQTGRKHWEKEKLLVTSNFSFSHSVFKGLVSQVRQKVSLCGNGLKVSCKCFHFGKFYMHSFCRHYWSRTGSQNLHWELGSSSFATSTHLEIKISSFAIVLLVCEGNRPFGQRAQPLSFPTKILQNKSTTCTFQHSTINQLLHNTTFWCIKDNIAVENIVRKGEIACNKLFLLFS